MSQLVSEPNKELVAIAAKQKIIAIDLLRAIAALGVFYYHTHIGSLIAKYLGLPFFSFTDAFGAFYAVPLFFLLSGYCIHASNIKYLKSNRPLPLKEYYIRRFLRIYPPYFMALLFSIIINYITEPNYKPGIADIFIHLFSLQGFSVPYFNTINLVLWTISIELAFYTIYPLFYYLRLKYNLNYALAFTFIVSCISIAYFQSKTVVGVTQYYCVLNLWFAWCCGAYLADKKMLNANNLKHPVYLSFYLIIVIAFVYLTLVPNNLSIVIYQLKILIWAGPLIFLLSREKWLSKRQNLWPIRVVVAIGLSSYSLYLLHEPLLVIKNWAAHKYLPAGLQIIGVTVGIFIIPFVTWLNYYFIEKPFMHGRVIAKK